MAGCCKGGNCSCRVVAGPNVSVTGTGTLASPFVISVTDLLSNILINNVVTQAIATQHAIDNTIYQTMSLGVDFLTGMPYFDAAGAVPAEAVLAVADGPAGVDAITPVGTVIPLETIAHAAATYAVIGSGGGVAGAIDGGTP